MTLDLEPKIEKDPFYLIIHSLRVEVPSSSFYTLTSLCAYMFNELEK